jgi:peptidoglycan/LPS O-acetylase OafA/YrhL
MQFPFYSVKPNSLAVPVGASVVGRNNNFNFLRLFFASLVLVSHAIELVDGNRNRELLTRIFGTLSFGELALDGFFLLSGFLILKSWQQQPKLIIYFSKRIRRIYPGFLMAFVISACVLAPLGASSVSTYFAQFHVMAELKNALLLRPPETPVIFGGTAYPIINGAMWTIGYEFRCYILVAIVGMLGTSWQKASWVMLFLLSIGLTIVVCLFPEMTSFGINGPALHYDNSVRLLSFFSAGACFYLFQRRIVFKGLYATVASALLLIAMFHFDTAVLALPTCGAYVLFWIASTHIQSLNYFKEATDISYGVYLYGWPIQKLLIWYFPTASPWLLLPPTFALCCLAGYASWRLVEAPFLSQSHKVLTRH